MAESKKALQTQTYESRCSGTYGSHYILKLIVTENSIDTDTNKSNITIKVTNQSEGNTWGNYGYANPTKIYVNDAERAYNNPTTDYRNQKENVLCEWTGDITHNDNGEKEISVRAEFSSTATHLSGGSVSGKIKLTTIPRASTVTANDSNIDSISNIVITRASDSFTHTLKYSFGDLSGTIVTKTNLTTVPFKVPTSFYTQIPNAKSGKCTITCETYNSDKLIGTKDTTFTAIANEELCKPLLSASAIDINDYTIQLTGDNNKLVNGYSNAQVTYSANPRNNATLTSVTVNGISASSPTIINKIMTGTITVVATDSRGYSTTVIIEKELINYIPLSVNPNFYRTQPTNGQVSLSFSGNYFNDNFGQVANTLVLTWSYRIKGQGDYIHGGVLEQGKHYVIDGNTFHSGTGSYPSPFIVGENFDYRNNYEFILYYTDKLISTGVQQAVTKGNPILWWNAKNAGENGDKFILNCENDSDCGFVGQLNGEEKGRIFFDKWGEALICGSGSNIVFRPNGAANYEKQAYVDPNGNFVFTGELISNSGYVKKYYGNQIGFNDAIHEGYYSIAGSNVDGAPYSGNIYGKLTTDINNCTTYNGSNNWIWQTFMDTYGNGFRRQRINAGAWSEWKLISRMTTNKEKLITSPVYSTGIGNVVGVRMSAYANQFDLLCVRVSNNNGDEGQWLTIPYGGNEYYYFNITMLGSWYFRGYIKVVGNEWLDFCVREVSGYDVKKITVSDVIGIRLV